MRLSLKCLSARLCAASFACLASLSPALADEIEHERLAALVRQIERIEREAGEMARNPGEARARYHFDYLRLRDDLQRVRAGIADYLTPTRAQPRDLAPMADGYTRASDGDAP